MLDDALGVSKMNVNPGGKQQVMRDGWWGGKPQKMNYSPGIPKGMRVILEERGVNTRGMNKMLGSQHMLLRRGRNLLLLVYRLSDIINNNNTCA